MGTLSIKTARRTGQLGKQFGPVALTALGALLFLASVGYGTYRAVLTNPGPVAVPDSVAEGRRKDLHSHEHE